MSTGKIEMIFGKNGSGKTSLALGKAVQAVNEQKHVIVIQFLKGSQKHGELEVIKRLEPEMKIFRFEKSERYFEQLSEEEKQEERINIRNGLNYAKKVLTTGECDLLVLDEVLGIIDQGIIGKEELKMILDYRDEAEVILTGQVMTDDLKTMADEIIRIDMEEIHR